MFAQLPLAFQHQRQEELSEIHFSPALIYSFNYFNYVKAREKGSNREERQRRKKVEHYSKLRHKTQINY